MPERVDLKIEPINVCKELYEKIPVENRALSAWKETKIKRQISDRKVNYFIRLGKIGLSCKGWEISAIDKVKFYKSKPLSPCEIQEHVVSLVETEIQKIFTKTEQKKCFKQKERGGSEKIVISTTHVLCDDCLTIIQEAVTFQEQVKELTLRVANIHEEDIDRLKEWVEDMNQSLTVTLEPIMVVWEIIKNKPQHVHETDWGEVVKKRIKNDYKVYKTIKTINNKIGSGKDVAELTEAVDKFSIKLKY